MRSDIVPGGIFPEYELTDHTGKLRKVSELQGDGPLILTLARGHWHDLSTVTSEIRPDRDLSAPGLREA